MKSLLLSVVLAVCVFAAEPASIDFTQPLHGLDGKPMMQGDAKSLTAITLGDVATTALETMIDEDKSASGETKFKQDELARKIYLNKKAVLTVEEIALIKTRIGKVFPPITVGAAWRLLDPALRDKNESARSIQQNPAPCAGGIAIGGGSANGGNCGSAQANAAPVR